MNSMQRLRKVCCGMVVAVIAAAALLSAVAQAAPEVVLYTSLDQIFSEPVIKQFERQTGVRVKTVYDTEAAKTTGLVNRLIAEKDNPQCDVFWNNEIARTIMLKKKGLLQPYVSPAAADIPPQFKDAQGYWHGFASRARVLIINTGMLSPSAVPQSIFDVTQPQWNGKFCLANPLFGTTATHCAALFVALGEEKARAYFQALKQNGVIIVPGNSVSRDRVAAGELPVGFTDTDDAWGAMSQGKAVNMVYPDIAGLGTLLIPNTVCLLAGAPHAPEARQLIDFILSPAVEEQLAFSESMQIPVRAAVKRPAHVPAYDALQVMAVDFEAVADRLESSAAFLQDVFLR